MTNRLRVARAEHRLSQMQTASAAQIGFNRYWRIENGYTDPTPEEREALAQALSATVDQLFPFTPTGNASEVA